MELNQLRVFYHVAKFKSFSLAAEALFVTRPAVSISVRHLEEHCDVRLFERSGKKIALTNAGEILFTYAEKVFNLVKEADNRLKDLNGSFSGTLKISSGLTIGTYYLAPLINTFRKKYPAVEIQMEVKNKKGVIEDILFLQNDLGFLGNVPTNANLVVTPLWREDLVVIASKPHSFGRKPSILPSQLSGPPFILREKGSGTREYIEGRLNQHRVSINTVMEIGSDEAIKRAVMVGLGISIVPKGVVEKEVRRGLIKTYRLSDENLVLEYFMIRHKDKYISNLISAFMEMALEFFPRSANRVEKFSP
jgi:LysR family transcriptional regulator, transcriptional activator of the cysJI operon